MTVLRALALQYTEEPMRIVMNAPAKINWALNILGIRENGYHELDMLMQTIELSDEIIFEEAKWLTLSVNGGPEQAGDRNLVIRAANALNAFTGQRRGARIQLKKSIPERAGLGGGSADCAAALVALNRLWGLKLPLKSLLDIGLKLGADVPFCLTGGLARVYGIGEGIRAMDDAPVIPLAMVTPGNGLSTQAVFKAWDEGGYPVNEHDMIALAEHVADRNLPMIQKYAFNALEAPAVKMMPEIGSAMEAFRAMGAKAVFMTGSGSTVVGAFETDEQAQSAASRIPGGMFTRTASSNGFEAFL